MFVSMKNTLNGMLETNLEKNKYMEHSIILSALKTDLAMWRRTARYSCVTISSLEHKLEMYKSGEPVDDFTCKYDTQPKAENAIVIETEKHQHHNLMCSTLQRIVDIWTAKESFQEASRLSLPIIDANLDVFTVTLDDLNTRFRLAKSEIAYHRRRSKGEEGGLLNLSNYQTTPEAISAKMCLESCRGQVKQCIDGLKHVRALITTEDEIHSRYKKVIIHNAKPGASTRAIIVSLSSYATLYPVYTELIGVAKNDFPEIEINDVRCTRVTNAVGNDHHVFRPLIEVEFPAGTEHAEYTVDDKGMFDSVNTVY